MPAGIPELDYLKGAELGQLLQREQLATAWALTEAQRPNFTIAVPTIDAAILGELFYLYELQTVMGGALLNVNPFGQPGVEAGKNATYALMGRAGLRDVARRTDRGRSGGRALSIAGRLTFEAPASCQSRGRSGNRPQWHAIPVSFRRRRNLGAADTLSRIRRASSLRPR